MRKTESGIVAIQTVRKHSEGYTKKEVEKEKLAHELQGMVGHPTDHGYKCIMNNQLLSHLPIRRVPYLGGQSLDTDPDFGRYWQFCGTIINVRTDINPYKRGT